LGWTPPQGWRHDQNGRETTDIWGEASTMIASVNERVFLNICSDGAGSAWKCFGFGGGIGVRGLAGIR